MGCTITGHVATGINVAVSGSLQSTHLPHGELVEPRTAALPSGISTDSKVSLTLPLVGAEGGRDQWLAPEEAAQQGGVF
ncbi:hypothetical protein FHS21_001172 [Phyllobacterium trifolii]|uniref:Uncharacterized protein n=1 Tax=Phyllobacterium trifolii TaxID=300193 RepID=A0A839U7T0_9HYPH|nr:hypothetical protein [Phyllobacterium trifolii]